MNCRSLVAFFLTLACHISLAPAAGWVAYNDCVDTDSGTTATNATSFGLGRNYQGDGDTGNLIDFSSGEDSGVTVSFVENFSTGNTINWATDAADYTPGTDAHAIFSEYLNLAGNLSYNDAPGWSLDLKFSNLDPAVRYTFAATANRNGGVDYQNRITNWSIRGVEDSTYACSIGANKVSDVSVEFSTGDNPDGLVARWTNILPAEDGTFAIHTTHGIGAALGGIPNPDPYKGYGGGIFMLEAQASEPANPLEIISFEYDKVAESATIQWRSTPDSIYVVEASSDLLEWTTISTEISAIGAVTSFSESEISTENSRRYYRVRRQ